MTSSGSRTWSVRNGRGLPLLDMEAESPCTCIRRSWLRMSSLQQPINRQRRTQPLTMPRQETPTYESSVTGLPCSVGSIVLPSEAEKKKRDGTLFSDGVPGLADDKTVVQSPSQTPSAQPSNPTNPLTFNGTRYGMGLKMDPDAIKETLLSDKETKKSGKEGSFLNKVSKKK